MGRILTIIKAFVFFANRTREVRDYIEDLNSIIAFQIKGEKPFYFKLNEGKIALSEGTAENSSVTLKADDKDFYRVLIGEMSQEEAFDKKLIRPEGAIVEAIRFRYISNLVLENNTILKYIRSFLSLF